MYVTLSLAYHALAYPIARPLYVSGSINGWYGVGWFALVFVCPAALGILLGLNVRKGWTKKLVNLNTIHPIHSAWDWHFGHCAKCYLIVTLKDNTKWYGYLGKNSFISSDPIERDIFIERVYDFAREGEIWTPRNTGVWIAHGEIQSLEFLPCQRDIE